MLCDNCGGAGMTKAAELDPTPTVDCVKCNRTGVIQEVTKEADPITE